MVKNKSQYFLSILILCVVIFAYELSASNTINTSPAVQIHSPQNGAVFQVGKSINFQGSAFDLEDGKLPDDNLIWESDIDNYLGKGATFNCSTLSSGSHIITLTAKDSQGFLSRDSVFIQIITCAKPKYVKSGQLKVVPTLPSKSKSKLLGICYNQITNSVDNDVTKFLLIKKITTDIRLAYKTATAMRTYSTKDTLNAIPFLCELTGIDYYPGARLGENKAENEKELKALISICRQQFNCIKALIVGSDVLLRRDLTEDELIGYIRRIKKSTDLPVTTGQMWLLWLKHPRLVQEVDFLLVHIHPFWEGIAIEKAALHVLKVCKYLQAVFPGKNIVVGETGWPSTGKTVEKAVPNAKNQEKFLKDLKQLLTEERFDYFYYKLSDPPMKKAPGGETETGWGIYNSDGLLKVQLEHLFERMVWESQLTDSR